MFPLVFVACGRFFRFEAVSLCGSSGCSRGASLRVVPFARRVVGAFARLAAVVACRGLWPWALVVLRPCCGIVLAVWAGVVGGVCFVGVRIGAGVTRRCCLHAIVARADSCASPVLSHGGFVLQ